MVAVRVFPSSRKERRKFSGLDSESFNVGVHENLKFKKASLEIRSLHIQAVHLSKVKVDARIP